MSFSFLQFHWLTSYNGVLLNRDDVGLAKRLPFGGVQRTRVSSQCMKYHLRTHQGEGSLRSIEDSSGKDCVPMSQRSRQTFEAHIRKPLEKDGIDLEIATAVTEALMAMVLGESAKKSANKKDKTESGAGKDEENGHGEGKKKKAKTEAAAETQERDKPAARENLETNQVVVLGRPEVLFLLDQARKIAQRVTKAEDAKKAAADHFTKDRIENLRTLKHGAGLDAALFGRMTTSDILARCDAAVHFSHALTVHGGTHESDYFAVVDELSQTEAQRKMGSGHIGTSELTSGLFYGYACVDLPLLVSNLEGCDRSKWLKASKDLAAEVCARLLKMIATVSPGAKLGSTAPYSRAEFVMLETGTSQPCTLGNAFLRPVATQPDLLQNTYAAVTEYLHASDQMYGKSNTRRFAAIRPSNGLHEVAEVEERGVLGLIEWVRHQITEAR